MNSRDFPKKFSQSGLLGSYLRVLEPGKISKNDEVEYIRKEKQSLSVYEVAEILFRDINNIDKMKQALD